MKNKLKILQGYISHLEDAEDGCDCQICLSQEQMTYADGLSQAIVIMEK